MTRVTLLAGDDAGAREFAIAQQLAGIDCSAAACAVILQGMTDTPAPFDAAIPLARIAPDCPCCAGNLTMRVTLNRMLRNAPARLFIGIADAAHIDGIRQFLTQAPYDTLLTLDDTLVL